MSLCMNTSSCNRELQEDRVLQQHSVSLRDYFPTAQSFTQKAARGWVLQHHSVEVVGGKVP